MKRPVNTNVSWELPEPVADFLAKHSPEAIAAWRRLVARTADVGIANNWTKAEVARRINMAEGTFHPWLSGKYIGDLEKQNTTVAQWLDTLEQNANLASRIPQSPAFIQLRSSLEVMDVLSWAQLAPDFVVVTLGAGMGKSMVCDRFAKSRPHVFHATVSESTKTTHGMLVELAAELEVLEHNPARLARAIGNKIRRTGDGTLLIVDEAQHLDDAAVNELRSFVDKYRCGVALVGNSEVYSRFSKSKQGHSYAQIKSRIGRRLHRADPYQEDLQAYITAWNVDDAACRQFLIGIGSKGGAFRQIDKTMRMALMIARIDDEPLELRHLRKAWQQRDVEDMS